MPGIPELKALLEGQVKQPATLSLEVVFDTKKSDVFDAIRQTEGLVEDARSGGHNVRGVLQYAGQRYEVK